MTSSITALLERVEGLESANNVLQQRVNILENTVSEQEQMIATLQAMDNSTIDRLQGVEEDLGEVEVNVQGTPCSYLMLAFSSNIKNRLYGNK